MMNHGIMVTLLGIVPIMLHTIARTAAQDLVMNGFLEKGIDILNDTAARAERSMVSIYSKYNRYLCEFICKSVRVKDING